MVITTVYGVSKLQHKNSIHSTYFTARTTYSNTCYFIIWGWGESSIISLFRCFFSTPTAVPKNVKERVIFTEQLCFRICIVVAIIPWNKNPENASFAYKRQQIMFNPVISCLFLKIKRLHLHKLKYQERKQLTMASYSLLNSI